MDGTISGKKVLVTGGAGFIGSNLIESLLEHDNQVICLDNFSTGKRSNLAAFSVHPHFSLLEGDIRDAEICNKAVEGVDIILHQAALGSVPRSIADPVLTNSVNITGFLNMLEAARQARVKRFVYAASSSTYGDSKELPKVEENIGKPLSPYAVTKYVNELYAGVYADLFGLEVVGLRYFNVFGKQQDPEGAYAAAIPKFISAFIRHQSPVIQSDGNQTRDFTYIKNVIQANHLAATVTNPQALNQVYNVACGHQVTLNDLVTKLQDLLRDFDPKIAEVEIMYGPGRVGDVRHSLASIEKAEKHLGYKPQYFLQDGLAEAIQWYWSNLK